MTEKFVDGRFRERNPEEMQTVGGIFQQMVRAIEYSEAAFMAKVRKLNRKKAKSLANSLLNPNIVEDKELATAFHSLAEEDPEKAKKAYSALLATKIHDRNNLKKILGL